MPSGKPIDIDLRAVRARCGASQHLQIVRKIFSVIRQCVQIASAKH